MEVLNHSLFYYRCKIIEILILILKIICMLIVNTMLLVFRLVVITIAKIFRVDCDEYIGSLYDYYVQTFRRQTILSRIWPF